MLGRRAGGHGPDIDSAFGYFRQPMDSPRPGALVRVLRRVLTFRSVVSIVYRHQQSLTVSSPVELRDVTPANVDDARAIDPPHRVEEFRRFLARGDRGVYGYLGGRMVHRSWLVRGPTVMTLWSRFGAWPVAAGAAYIHYCETAPDARGRNIYPAALIHLARDSGAGDLFIATEEANAASRRGIEKAGFVEIAHITLRVAFGIGHQSVSRG